MKKFKFVSFALISLVSLALAVALPCAARADVLYSTGAGTLGRIAITNNGANGISADVVPLMNGISTNAKIFAFSQFGTHYAMLTETGSGYDQARIYKLNSQNVSENPDVVTLTGVRGAWSVLEAGNSPKSTVFVVGKDSGSVVEFENQSEGWPERESYVFTRDWTEDNMPATVTGVDVIRHDRRVYMLFGCGQNSGKLIITDGRLASGDLYVSCDVGPDPVGIVNTHGFDAAIAYRGNGSNGGIDLFRGGEVRSLISGSSMGSIEAIASDNDEGFYFVEVKDNAAKLMRWIKDNNDNVYSEVPDVSLNYNASSDIQAMWDGSKDVLVVLSGGEILLLNNEGQTRRMTSSNFGGALVCVAAASSNDDDDDSDNGCNLGFAGFTGLALLGLGVAFRRSHR